MSVFENWLRSLEALGLRDVLLPFLLIFTITYAVFQKSKILGEKSHRFNTIVAFVIAMAAVIPHVTKVGPDVVVIINNALPNVSLFMVIGLTAMLLIGIFGPDVNIAGSGIVGLVVLGSIIAVGYAFLSAAGFVARPPTWLAWLLRPDIINTLVAIIVFGIIIAFITREEDAGKERKSVNEVINDMFGGVLKGKK